MYSNLHTHLIKIRKVLIYNYFQKLTPDLRGVSATIFCPTGLITCNFFGMISLGMFETAVKIQLPDTLTYRINKNTG